MATLYEIGREFQDLEEFMLSIGGDVSDAEIESMVVRRFTELEMSREAKLEGYGMLLRNLATRAKARKEEGKRLTELGRADETAEKRLKAHLLTLFELFGWTEEVQTTRFKFKPINNGGNVPVKIADAYRANPELLPEKFRAVSYAPDTEAIREALEAGEELEFAEFGERGKYISIK